MRDEYRVLSNMELSTNSGVPFFTKRRKSQFDDLVLAQNHKKYPAILGWRGQEGGPNTYDVKQRVI